MAPWGAAPVSDPALVSVRPQGCARNPGWQSPQALDILAQALLPLSSIPWGWGSQDPTPQPCSAPPGPASGLTLCLQIAQRVGHRGALPPPLTPLQAPHLRWTAPC